MNLRPTAVSLAISAGLASCASHHPTADGIGKPAVPALADVRATRVDPKTGIGETLFPNGLRLLTRERRDLPVVTTIVAYRVGSVNELKGYTGISHFIEHMMFKGTARLKKGDIDEITQRNGGQNNAFTTYDYTAYWFSMPADRLDAVLEVEADRMRNCSFDAHELDAERGPILSELEGGLDVPGGLLEQEVDAAAFVQHPYHHPVIGWQEDVEHVSREEVVAHYDRYYRPNNTTLCVVGDFDTPVLVAKIDRLFGSIARGPDIPEIWSKEPPMHGEKRIVVRDKTEVPRLMMRYRTCAFSHPDQIALDVLEEVLSTGKSSRLYRRLLERDRSVTGVSATSDARRLDGLLSIEADLALGASLDSVEQAIDEELDALCEHPVSAGELTKAKNSLRADFVFNGESATDEANRIVDWQMLGSLDALAGYLDAIDRVTVEDIQRVASSYLTKEHRVVGWSLPEDDDEGETEGSDTAPHAGGPPTDPDSGHSPKRRARSATARVAGTPATIDALPVKRTVLPNGLVLLLLPRPGPASIALDLEVDAGHRFDPPGKEGLSELTGRLLEEGTLSRTGEEIAEAIDSVGGTLESGNDGVAVHVLSRDVGLAIDLLADVAMHPRFAADDVEKVRARMLSEIVADRDDPETLGANAFREIVYGDHPYHTPEKGTEATVKTLTRDEIAAFHRRTFVANRSILAITGDFDPAEIERRVTEVLGGWQRSDEPASAIAEAKPQTSPVEKHIAFAGRQAHVFLGHLGVRRNDPDYIPLVVLDNVLGTAAGFTARLPHKLRDEEGLAYTVFANVTSSAGLEPGLFTAYIGTSPENVTRATAEMRAEIERIREEPITSSELANVKDYLLGSFVFRLETRAALASFLVGIERYGLGFDYPKKFREAIRAVTVDDVRRVAREHLRPESMTLVIVGEPETAKPKKNSR
ncbi:MAG: insulinase family protein [Planctomycetes bacterium]|nr:insulinase family protein [Planctomycetota bacterium]